MAASEDGLGEARPLAGWRTALPLFVVGAAVAISMPLLVQRIRASPMVWSSGLRDLFALIVVHVLGLLFLGILGGMRGRNFGMYWILSAGAVVVAGRAPSLRAFLCLGLLALVLIGVGRGIARGLFAGEDPPWPFFLAFGILYLSFLATVLAAFRILTPWGVGAALLGSLLLSLRIQRPRESADRPLRRFLAGVGDVRPSSVLVIEALFLVGALAWVAGSAPEGRSDALRVYLPYARYLARFHGFPDLPSQWAFIVPQAGVPYTAAVLSLFGERAMRESMLLCLAALAGMALSRGKGDRTLRGVVVILVVCAPLVLILSSSLMQESFVALATVSLALACLDGETPGRTRSWFLIGALMGLAVAAKYTSVVYGLPLLGIAVWRSLRAVGPARSLRGLAAATAGGLATSGWWFWRSYTQSGNPFFPFFTGLIRTPLWPHGLGKANLDRFARPQGFRGLLTWPFDATFHTERFVEGRPGDIGLVLLALVPLAILAVTRKNGRAARWWIGCAALGTAILWTETAYLRYWIPALWLTAAGIEWEQIREGVGRFLLSAAALTISMLQLPVAVTSLPFGQLRLPWQLYLGTISEEAYLDRVPGHDAVRQLGAIDPNWPRIWYTGYDAVGHLEAVPLEAALWQIQYHGIAQSDLDGIARFLESQGCDYWVVGSQGSSREVLVRAGVGRLFWRPDLLIATEGGTDVYRMPGSERALAAWEKWAAKPKPPEIDLLPNTGFALSRHGRAGGWALSGDSRLEAIADDRSGTGDRLHVGPGGEAVYSLPVPADQWPAVKLEEQVRSEQPSHPRPFRLQINWLDARGQLLDCSMEIVRPSADWREYQMHASVPQGSARAILYLSNQDAQASNEFRSVRLLRVAGE